jgi:hypothetical protein
VFHVSLLEPYHRKPGDKPAIIQPDLAEDKDRDYEVDQILDKRITNGQAEWLIRWTGCGPAEDQWLTKEYLAGCQRLVKEFKRRHSDQKAKRPIRTASESPRKRRRTQRS